MKVYDFKGKKVTIKVITSITPNRIQIYDSETCMPISVVTESIPSLNHLQNYVAVKTQAHNSGMLEFLMDNGIVESPLTYIEEFGINYPICKLK
jgi:hypothetical protein